MTLTKKEITNYIKTNYDFLNLKAIAEKAGIDQSTLHKAVNGTIMKGCNNPIEIQDKYVQGLSDVILSLKFKRS